MLRCVHLNILNLLTVCWFLYLVRTADNALYTGITTDVERRFLEHQTGKGAKALRGKGSLTLVFSAHVGDRSLALRMEYRIKQLTKREKERLVTGDGSFEALQERLQNLSAKSD
ncbi:GIY-YIG nuclease family protein [Enterobacter sp. RHBSTW-00994]|uniref:GIY-YIG nuclease family protein n=1 Tax=Enterobacter sp. RHBSTW-00994 TaxID=2742676 RepID=UPI0015EAC6A2|nr:GIY-YIG nuclease family protein [Enterobacter sp. RHBSTW-00994]QLR45608.1 GIY-YIG nuclease family protein [Enterobacter sp. RHBSTW-00994]